MKSSRLLILILGLLSYLALLPAAGAAPRPNIIVILADDVGFSDIGCYGSEIPTPNLDRLAAGGVRFTQFYNNARCSPTRASLLTGLYSHQAGIGHTVDDRGFEAYRGDLNRRCATLAEALKPAGYRTYAAGKWHVTPGKTPEALADKHNWPLQRGFDRYYGTINGAGSFWDPDSLVRDNQEITTVNDPDYQPAEFYNTDAISDNATRFIREHARDHASEPFLLYLAYTAAHWPLHARDRDIAKHRGRYDAGYAAIAATRWEKQKKLGLVQESWGLPPPDEDWSQVENRDFETRCMEVYAAMIEVMDEGIGRMVDELKAEGKLDNTLIYFLQDNGGCAENIGRIYGVLPGPADTFVSYGRGWANVSDTPFREYKRWDHEGGISTPLIVHWPAGIPTARRGGLEAQPGHVIDIMTTCVDVAGAAYPAQLHGEAVQPMEGVSLRPALAGESLARPQRLCWEHEGNRAIRAGKWKLVSKYPGRWELYDIEADRTEQHDLAARQPARVKRMSTQWHEWAKRVGVQPWKAVQAATP